MLDSAAGHRLYRPGDLLELGKDRIDELRFHRRVVRYLTCDAFDLFRKTAVGEPAPLLPPLAPCRAPRSSWRRHSVPSVPWFRLPDPALGLRQLGPHDLVSEFETMGSERLQLAPEESS